jgi:PAS domain S-box-containing protein
LELERLRTMFEHAFALIGLLTPEGVLLELNRGGLLFAGAECEAVLGTHLLEAPWTKGMTEATREWLRHALKEAAAGRFLRTELELLDASGRQVVLELSLTPVLEQQRVTYLVAEGRDITERKRAEEERRFLLRAGELLARTLDFEATLEQVAELLVPKLADCCLIHLLGQGDTIEVAAISHVHPDKARTLRELYQQYPSRLDAPHGSGRVIRTGQPEILSEISDDVRRQVARNDEHLKMMRDLALTSALIVPLRAHERVVGCITLSMSESGRHVAERELAFAEELAHLAALALENAQLYRAARRATRTRDDVLGIVAHDLRSPLSAISMSAQLVEQQLQQGRTGQSTQQMMALIQRMAQRMGRLVEDLLDISRLEAGQLSVTLLDWSPGRLLSEAVEQVRPMATGLSLHTEVADGLPEVRADRHRVIQVLANLLGNALKFTPDGGHITAGVRSEDGMLRFWVTDTGPGIPLEHQPHLFDRFWQARRDDHRGAGLGLAICKHLVEAHGGRIGVDSAPGRGSTFWFSLLAAPARADPLAFHKHG